MKERIIFWLLKRIAVFTIKHTKHPPKCFELGFNVTVDGVYYPVLFHSNMNILNWILSKKRAHKILLCIKYNSIEKL